MTKQNSRVAPDGQSINDSASAGDGVTNRNSSTLGPRAERTRQRLIDAAAKLFRENGFLLTSVSDIVREADVSVATFYVYFAERTDIVAVLLDEVVSDVVARGVGRWDPRSGRIGLSRVVTPYVESVATHAEFYRLWQSVIQVDARMHELYTDYNRTYQDRFTAYLEQGVELGLVRADLDPAGMAVAMTLMMERYCYEVFVAPTRPERPSVSEVAVLITTLWADAINLTESTVRPRTR